MVGQVRRLDFSLPALLGGGLLGGLLSSLLWGGLLGSLLNGLLGDLLSWGLLGDYKQLVNGSRNEEVIWLATRRSHLNDYRLER